MAKTNTAPAMATPTKALTINFLIEISVFMHSQTYIYKL
jgi:hypothetical protein